MLGVEGDTVQSVIPSLCSWAQVALQNYRSAYAASTGLLCLNAPHKPCREQFMFSGLSELFVLFGEFPASWVEFPAQGGTQKGLSQCPLQSGPWAILPRRPTQVRLWFRREEFEEGSFEWKPFPRQGGGRGEGLSGRQQLGVDLSSWCGSESITMQSWL